MGVWKDWENLDYDELDEMSEEEQNAIFQASLDGIRENKEWLDQVEREERKAYRFSFTNRRILKEWKRLRPLFEEAKEMENPEEQDITYQALWKAIRTMVLMAFEEEYGEVDWNVFTCGCGIRKTGPSNLVSLRMPSIGMTFSRFITTSSVQKK